MNSQKATNAYAETAGEVSNAFGNFRDDTDAVKTSNSALVQQTKSRLDMDDLQGIGSEFAVRTFRKFGASALSKVDNFALGGRVQKDTKPLNDWFDKKLSQAKDVVKDAKMKLKTAVDDAKGKVGDMSNKAQSAVDDAKQTLNDAKSKVSQVQSKAQSAVDDVKSKVSQAQSKATSAVDDVKSKASSAMDDAKAKVGAIEDDAKSSMNKAQRISKVSKRVAKSRIQKMRRNRLERNGRTRKTLDDTEEGDVELPDKSIDVKAPKDFGKQRSSWGETKQGDDMLPDDAESLNRGGTRGKMMSMDEVDAEIQKRSGAGESKTEDANLQETKTQDPSQPKSTQKNPDAEDDLEGDLEDVGENAAEDVGEDTAGGFLEGLGAAASATGIGAVVGIPLALGGAILEGAGLYESAKSAVDWFERDILGEQPKIALNKLPSAPITAVQSGQMITPNSDTMDTQPSYSGGW